MVMKTLYHGTSYENYLKIKEEGLKDNSRNWYCSEGDTIYFYDLDKFKLNEDLEEEREIISRAFESASLCAAFNNSMSKKLVVFKIEIDESLVKDDYSCENMSSIASCVDIDDLKNIEATVIMCEDYKPSLKLFYVNGLRENEQAIFENFEEYEREALESIKDIFMEELLEFEEIERWTLTL